MAGWQKSFSFSNPVFSERQKFSSFFRLASVFCPSFEKGHIIKVHSLTQYLGLLLQKDLRFDVTIYRELRFVAVVVVGLATLMSLYYLQRKQSYSGSISYEGGLFTVLM